MPGKLRPPCKMCLTEISDPESTFCGRCKIIMKQTVRKARIDFERGVVQEIYCCLMCEYQTNTEAAFKAHCDNHPQM